MIKRTRWERIRIVLKFGIIDMLRFAWKQDTESWIEFHWVIKRIGYFD